MTAAGAVLQQIWILGDSRDEVIRGERELRRRIYRTGQEDCSYPACWEV